MKKLKLKAFFKSLFPQKRKDVNNEWEIVAVSSRINNNSDITETMVQKFSYDETKPSISILPVEILEKIFQYLEFCDRMNASVCCKQWRVVFLHFQFLDNVIVKANNSMFTSRPMSSQNTQKSLNHISQHRASSAMSLSSFSMSSISKYNSYMYNNCVNLQFDGDSADVSLFLKNLGHSYSVKNEEKNVFLLPKVESLKFKKTTMSSKTLMEMLSEVPSISNLEIIECDSLFMTGFLSYDKSTMSKLTNLTSLSLSYNRYLTDVVLNIFIDSAPNLSSLDISFCNLVKQNFKSIQANTIPDVSKVSLTLENLIEKTLNLKMNSVDISGIEIFNHQPASLLNLLKNMKSLTDVQLTNLPGLKVETVTQLYQLLPHLNCINLNNSIQDYDFSSTLKSVDSIFKDFILDDENESSSRIRVIKLSKARINYPINIADNLVNFKYLKHLDLSNAMIKNPFVNVKQQKQFIEKFGTNLATCEQMDHLDLSYCDILVNDTFIKIISKRLHGLKYLNLRNCSQITDVSLHFISFYLKNLAELDLSWCQNISDNGLNFQIEVDQKQKLVSDFTTHLNSSCSCMKKFRTQPFLFLKTKSELSSEMHQNICTCGAILTTSNSTEDNEQNDKKSYLELALELENQDFSLKRLKKLKTLKLESCKNITDVGLKNGVNLFQLKELDIKLCTNITGSFVDIVETNVNMFFISLRCLNLNQCIGLEEKNVLKLIRSAPNLRELSLSAISSISNTIVDVLLDEKRMLLTLDISFCPNLSESELDRYEQFLFNELGSREFVLDKRFISK